VPLPSSVRGWHLLTRILCLCCFLKQRNPLATMLSWHLLTPVSVCLCVRALFPRVNPRGPLEAGIFSHGLCVCMCSYRGTHWTLRSRPPCQAGIFSHLFLAFVCCFLKQRGSLEATQVGFLSRVSDFYQFPVRVCSCPLRSLNRLCSCVVFLNIEKPARRLAGGHHGASTPACLGGARRRPKGQRR